MMQSKHGEILQQNINIQKSMLPFGLKFIVFGYFFFADIAEFPQLLVFFNVSL